MKALAMNLCKTLTLAAWLPLASVLAGCGSVHSADPVNPTQPFAFPGQTATGVAVAPTQPAGVAMPSLALTQAPVPIAAVAVNPNQMPNQTISGVLAVGDLIRVSLLDIPQPPPPVEIRIPE